MLMGWFLSQGPAARAHHRHARAAPGQRVLRPGGRLRRSRVQQRRLRAGGSRRSRGTLPMGSTWGRGTPIRRPKEQRPPAAQQRSRRGSG